MREILFYVRTIQSKSLISFSLSEYILVIISIQLTSLSDMPPVQSLFSSVQLLDIIQSFTCKNIYIFFRKSSVFRYEYPVMMFGIILQCS